LNLQKLSEPSPKEDTVFEELPSMIIDSFSDEALKQLTKLFMGDTSAYYKSDDEEEYSAKRGWLSKLFDGDLTPLITSAIGGGLGAMVPAALTGLTGLAGGALLVGSLVWLATDAIRGWLSAEKWGVSKGSALVGAMLAGTGEGLQGALVNAGKGATIGATIGMMVGGPVGIVFGGLIGAAVGGILGWFGGQKVAKALDAAHDDLTEWWTGETMRFVKQSLGLSLPEPPPSSENMAFHAEQRNKLRKMGFAVEDTQTSMPSQQWDKIMTALEKNPQANYWLIEEMWKIQRDQSDEYTALIIEQLKNRLTPLDSLLPLLLKRDEKLVAILQDKDLADPSLSPKQIANYLELHGYHPTTPEFKDAMDYLLDKRSSKMSNDMGEFEFDVPSDDEPVLPDDSKSNSNVRDNPTNQFWLNKLLDRFMVEPKQQPPDVWRYVQDSVLDFQQLKIIPDKNDQYYPMKDSGLLAKDGGTIDKKLDKVSANINTLIKAVEDKLNSVVTELNGHAKILQNIADMSNLQYEFMPALVPASPAPLPTPVPVTDTRDSIFEYRNKVYERGRL